MPADAVHPASVQDRDGLVPALDRRPRRRLPVLEIVFADRGHHRGHQGRKAATAVAEAGSWTPDIGHRVAGRKGFAVLPMRRAVERALSRLGRSRRPAEDVE